MEPQPASPERTFFVIDVESIGLHGTGFAVGYVVVRGDTELESGIFACRPDVARGSDDNRAWVNDNIPTLPDTHANPAMVRAAFWRQWQHWQGLGAVMAADCPWPVEARFLAACVDDENGRDWQGPYPIIDVASAILARGGDPLLTRERKEREVPVHNPLADARQSARLLIEALRQP